jgi:Rieske Fe-S protein
MPGKFEPDDLLSIKITGDGVIVAKENIPTFNVLKINTEAYPELKLLGGFQKISISKGDIWLKRISTNEMKAFSGQCTHAGCGIDFLKSDNLFYCSCHGSKFSSDGLVLNGPASLPLNQYRCQFIAPEAFKVIH